ncbi:MULTISPECIES: glycoside hydrolase family 1 protein [unclassified Streptomyces]|uniref:glycoside hydrolase family 1 protein n=1 Tax=unclassified Streptomyces TaxID=2593676 RepID=UPI00088C9757|nr:MULTISPECIES: family 1 glycosylhydrolase [unclassified Streptomyces]PBC82330.1 beta-glucosidase [Streptomyces sp. 2321.6]SDR50222.1 beta-glucosidase [Streptomyces sp. KS_16]SEC53364.1 beta-glucosidase [Streptomyces sp. 2133.1]SNC68132.1 beta-glucosidase [Streptomyces sp. 2114.4]
MTTEPVPAPLPRFPRDFLWGVSTSAPQIEGAVEEDGRGRSVWDVFAAGAGRIKDGSDARVTTDHYHRYREDVGLLRELGVGAYRFSVAWPRVVPDGDGAVNGAGLDFYDRLVDALLAAGVAPVPTLFHWDTPQALEERGGWLRRETAERFAAYADVVAGRLGDRVERWITLNEPAEVTLLGYGLGQHAPGRQLLFDALPAAHHQLLGHGLAVQALRARGATDIGIANSHGPTWTASASEADTAAAGLYDLLLNRLFAEPVLLGRYPDEELAALLPGPVAEDLQVIAEPVDRYGINYYQPTLVGAPAAEGAAGTDEATGAGKAAGTDFGGIRLPPELPFAPREIEGYPRTDFGWPVVPEALTELLVSFRERYGDRLPPVVITENGCSYEGIEDRERIAFLDGHLRALHAAMAAGVDVRGYFVWSLMDNFEWAEGYARRFGLVHVDYATLKRTPKASYRWLQGVLREQARG